MSRPELLVVVTGTGTEVGKTWLAAGVAAALRDRGLHVAARKPVQSFEPGGGPTDADVLAGATGEESERVCVRHRWYEVAMAPPMAADALGRPGFTIADLVAELAFDAGVDVGLVEGAGGVASPLTSDGDTAALARALDPDFVVLVADSALGVVSHTRLAVRALTGLDTVVFLNRYHEHEEVHRRSRDWLVEVDGLRVFTDVRQLSGALVPSKSRGARV